MADRDEHLAAAERHEREAARLLKDAADPAYPQASTWRARGEAHATLAISHRLAALDLSVRAAGHIQ